MVKKMTWAVRLPQICIGIVLLIAGYVAFMLTDFAVFDAIKGPVALTGEMNLQEMEGQYVSYEVKYPLGSYMEEMVTKKVNGVSRGTSKSRLGYVVYDENRDDFLAVECAVKQEDGMEELADQFWAALDGEGDVAETGIVVKGSLELLSGEDLRYYKKALGSVLDEVPDTVYVITGGKIKGDTVGSIYGISAFGVALALIGLVALGNASSKAIGRSVADYLAAHPQFKEEELEQDFSGALKLGSLWVGKRWTFGMLSDKKAIHENDTMIWVYPFSERSGKNTVSMMGVVFLDGSFASKTLSGGRTKKAMAEYDRLGHIVTGNDSSYRNVLAGGLDDFLKLKYYPAKGMPAAAPEKTAAEEPAAEPSQQPDQEA